MTEKTLRNMLFYTLLITPFVIGMDFIMNNRLILGADDIDVSVFRVRGITHDMIYMPMYTITLFFVILSVVFALCLRGAYFDIAHLAFYSTVIVAYYACYGLALHGQQVFGVTNKIIPIFVASSLVLLNLYIAILKSIIVIKKKLVDDVLKLPLSSVLYPSGLLLLMVVYFTNSSNELHPTMFIWSAICLASGLISLLFLISWAKQGLDYKLLRKRRTVVEQISDKSFIDNANYM